MEIGRFLVQNPKLARTLSIPTRRFLLPPNVVRTGISSDDGLTRQRAPVGDPLSNEQWSDHLSDPSSH